MLGRMAEVEADARRCQPVYPGELAHVVWFSVKHISGQVPAGMGSFLHWQYR
jgi:NADH pyrophosphatase NudC (nudix superfamily)